MEDFYSEIVVKKKYFNKKEVINAPIFSLSSCHPKQEEDEIVRKHERAGLHLRIEEKRREQDQISVFFDMFYGKKKTPIYSLKTKKAAKDKKGSYFFVNFDRKLLKNHRLRKKRRELTSVNMADCSKKYERKRRKKRQIKERSLENKGFKGL
ncbi:MAG: hypothetical protein PUC75_04190 [Lachnospiraceae bacterium]|nr:hypothetical protein [Lachnospiraceae bacterium]